MVNKQAYLRMRISNLHLPKMNYKFKLKMKKIKRVEIKMILNNKKLFKIINYQKNMENNLKYKYQENLSK